jgi:hypothetical protein
MGQPPNLHRLGRPEAMRAEQGGAFVGAQLLGAALGALVTTLDYVVLKGGDALSNFYCTAPLHGVSFANAFVDEVLATTTDREAICSCGPLCFIRDSP